MKLFISFLLVAFISCNNNNKGAASDGMINNKDQAADTTTDKENFMSSCMIDASNPLRTPDEENRDVAADEKRVRSFCECAWEQTKGKYPGSIIADKTKLKIDAVLAACWQAAHK